MSLNQVQLIGYLGQNPEKRVTQQGKEVFTLSVATSYKIKQQDGSFKEMTDWHRVTVFNQVNFMQYLHKGDLVYIKGRLHYNQDEVQGVKRYFTQIICDEIQKLNKSQEAQDQGESENIPSTPSEQQPDSDIPF